jgi:nucleotide-binding universal stress UspA family protein
MDVFSRPLVAVDNSVASALAVDLALHLARSQRGSAVRFLSVVELAAAQAEHRKALDEAVDRACVAQVEASCTMRHGHDVDAILDEARDSNASCIVVGSHGSPAGQRSALGSRAEGVLRRSRLPVFIAHAPALRDTARAR